MIFIIFFFIFFANVFSLNANELVYKNSTGEVVEIVIGKSGYVNSLEYTVLQLDSKFKNKNLKDLIFDLNENRIREKTVEEKELSAKEKKNQDIIWECVQISMKLKELKEIKKRLTSIDALQIANTIELSLEQLLNGLIDSLNND